MISLRMKTRSPIPATARSLNAFWKLLLHAYSDDPSKGLSLISISRAIAVVIRRPPTLIFAMSNEPESIINMVYA
jgi:hypothetical protein